MRTMNDVQKPPNQFAHLITIASKIAAAGTHSVQRLVR